MKPKLTFLLALTFLFLFSGSSVVFGGDLQDGLDAANKGDFKTAYKLNAPLAEQGDALAQHNLGLMYDNGQGIPQDYKEAIKWYRLSAKQGYVGAQVNLGIMYFKGRGVPQDSKEAVKLYRLAAEQGSAIGQYNLGFMYEKGHGVLQDHKEAFRLYRLSAEQGYADAQGNLGWMYSKGQGVPQDHTEAFKLLSRSAEQGHADTQNKLGFIHERGQGVTQDYKEAIRLYRLSAEQGHVDAQHNLGLMYAEGKGVLQDYLLAHMWWSLASSNGQKDAVRNRNILENIMTTQQIVEAQQLARNWKPNNKIRTAESLPTISPQPSIPQPPKSKNVAIATGTGFLFGSRDYIVTNYHVVKGTSQVKVKFLNEEIFDAQVIAKDIQNDVAILKLNKTPSLQTIEMKFGDSSRVRMGDKVFTIGYPSTQILGTKPKYSEGVISAVTGMQDNPTMFQTTVPILPGSSGSPLFNENGEVVGLTTGSLSSIASDLMGSVSHNINYAVKSSFVKNIIGTVPDSLFSNRGIVVVPTDSNSRADFIEAISKNVVLILGKVD